MKKNLLIAFVALLVLLTAASPAARAQGDKGSSVKTVQRLNRAPVSKDILSVHLPRPSVHKLPNGLTVILLEQHKLPTVAFELWIRPGQLDDPKDLPGLASFTADMLREGTARRNSQQIASEVDNLGASLESTSAFGQSYSQVSASGLVTTADQLLDLMSDVTLHPSFAPDELAKYKQRALAQLEEDRSQPGFLAGEQFRRALYGDFPAGVVSATPDSVNRVSAADLQKVHHDYYNASNAMLGVVGDFQSADMLQRVEKYFAEWPAGSPAPALTAAMPPPQPERIILVDRPGSVQTNIRAGNLGIRRNDPDFFALQVMNRVVGGGPQARLFLNLREDKGYTYGAYSNTQSYIYPGSWSARTEVRTAVTDGSMHELQYEFKRIGDEPVPPAELDEAKHSLVAEFALALEDPHTLINEWLTAKYYGLPDDYWDTYPDHIAAIDAAAVQAAGRKYADLPHMQWVAVGDAKQIKEVLAKYGPVTAFDANGKPE
jgi:zinc protease